MTMIEHRVSSGMHRDRTHMIRSDLEQEQNFEQRLK